MTDEQFISWLKDQSAIRTVLMEVDVLPGYPDSSVVTRYLSSRGYVTSPSDTPANQVYKPIITGGVEFTESIAVQGDFSINYGDIELLNINGDIDSWLDDYWTNRNVTLYMGDVSWPRSDFRAIFSGVVADIDIRNRNTLNLKIADKLQKLNTPISEVKLGGTSANADKLIPLTFGEVHNVEPLLVSSSLHTYAVHDGTIEDIIEVRDNGVPVSFTKNVSTGRFTLSQSPAGTITASVQGGGSLTYTNDVAGLIKAIVTGWVADMSVADIDEANFDAFSLANPQPVGIYLKDRANALDVCNQLAESVGARLTVTREGLLRLVKIDLPRLDAGTSVSAADMIERSIEIESLPEVRAGCKIGYCKNYTVQTNLQTGIPSEHIDLFATEWLTVTQTDSSTESNFQLFTELEMEETLLQVGSDALLEASRRLELFNVRRKVIKYVGLPHLMLEQLGNTQTLTHSRFGLSGGVAGQIVQIKTDWLKPRVEISVLV